MSHHTAFLGAINVGNGRTLKMKSLRQSFESPGFSKVETFIASGNVLFETTRKSAKSLEKKIQNKLQQELGYEVTTFLRTEAELARIAHARPFPDSRIRVAAEFNILLLPDKLDPKSRKRSWSCRLTRMNSISGGVRSTGCDAKRWANPPSSGCHLRSHWASGLPFARRKRSKRIALKISGSKHA